MEKRIVYSAAQLLIVLFFFPCCTKTFAQKTDQMYAGAVTKITERGLGLSGSYNWFPVEWLGLEGGIGGEIGSVLKKRYSSYNADLFIWYEPISFLDRASVQIGIGGTGTHEQLELGKGIELKEWNYGIKGSARLLLSLSDRFFIAGLFAQNYRIRKDMGHWKWEIGIGCLVKI